MTLLHLMQLTALASSLGSAMICATVRRGQRRDMLALSMLSAGAMLVSLPPA